MRSSAFCRSFVAAERLAARKCLSFGSSVLRVPLRVDLTHSPSPANGRSLRTAVDPIALPFDNNDSTCALPPISPAT